MPKGKRLILLLAAITLVSACTREAPEVKTNVNASITVAASAPPVAPVAESEAELLALLQRITAADPSGDGGPEALRPFAAAIFKGLLYDTAGQRPVYFSARLEELEGQRLLTLFHRKEPGVFIADRIYIAEDTPAKSVSEEVSAREAGVLLEEGSSLIFFRSVSAPCPFAVAECTRPYYACELMAIDLSSQEVTQLLPSRVYLELAVTRLDAEQAEVELSWHLGEGQMAFMTGTISLAGQAFTQTAYREEAASAADYHPDLQPVAGAVSYATVGGVPVSITIDGAEQIAGQENWYFEVAELALSLVSEQSPPKLQNYPVTKGFSGPAPDYALLGADTIGLYGDWNPFPTSVIWRSYTPANQPYQPAWTEHFTQLLAGTVPDSPVLITDVFYFDLDGDGEDEAVVSASNIFVSDSLEPVGGEVAENLPHGDITGCYSITALFSSTLGTITLYQWAEPVSSVATDYGASFGHFAAGSDYYNDFSSYQLDDKGNIIVSPIFNKGAYYPSLPPYPIVFDCDGNGKAELMFIGFMEYFSCPVYKIVEGALVHSHSVTFPA